MPVTITGGKYSGSVTSLTNSYQLNNSSGAFSSGDFNVGRIVGLWNSAGTTYKGVAWIRRWISSTQLELVAPFIDKDGNTVTQTVGDTYLVSKNFADSVTTGITVSGSSATISDRITFGTNNVNNSVCFYDESKNITVTSAATSSPTAFFVFAGGLSVFGRLDDYAAKISSQGCNLINQNSTVTAPIGTGGIGCSSTAAKLWWLDGSIFNQSTPVYVGEWFDGSYVGQGSAGEFQYYWNVFSNADFLSPGSGGSWTVNANYQKMINIKSLASSTNSINARWGDGVIEGGSFTLTGSTALSVFGSDVSGTFNIGSSSGLLLINDLGTGNIPVLWRTGNSTLSQTINFLNVVTPNRKLGVNNGTGSDSTAHTNATSPHRFSGLYTNLINGTLGLVKNNNLLSTVQDSGTASGNQLTLTIQEASVTGFTETVTENSWTYGFYLYGYQIYSGTFVTTTRIVSAGQTAKQVVFGGPVAQIIDVNITQSTAATVAAYTQLENSDKAYDYSQYWKALNAANAIYPAYNQQLIANTSGTLSTPGNNNIVFDSSAGSVFNVNTSGQGTITFKSSGWTSTAKSDTFQLSASRTLTFSQAGDKSGFSYLVPNTGTVVVASGTTILSGTFAGTIDVSSGSATVIIPQSQLATATAGSNVTLRARVAITVSWPGVSQAYVSIQVGGSEVVNSGLTTSPYTYNYDYTGNPTVTVKVLRQGYSRFYTSFSAATSTTQSISAVLTPNTTAYTGSTNAALTLTVDAADAAHKIRIGNAQIPVQTIYDVIEDAAVNNPLRNNLQVFPTLTINGAYLTLNTSTQLIRNTSGDVNAAVLGAVFRSDGSAPIDGTNGGVLLLGPQGLTQQNVRDAMALALTVGTTVQNTSIEAYTGRVAKRVGLVPGVSATHGNTAITTSDGISQAITDNGNGTYTVSSSS